MLKNAKYILDNILIADEVNTTLKYCKAATGVDLSARRFFTLTGPGVVYQKKTIVKDYKELSKVTLGCDGVRGWYLPKGSYICELNEGCQFGPKDVGYIVLRSSLNRNCVSLTSAVWDPNFHTRQGDVVMPMSVRITVDTPEGIWIEENARVGQLLVFEIEDGATQYDGQWQGGINKSSLE